ncbi:lipocalin family protein [Mangrovimonas sp. YM274]|uniref:lipocalin family protein n=1 Tax=Mangrovimonas sp. YM274 TaxID=3070660 RepID=UPI0027DADAE6|nr:lipocalin family protein [Mangrovimonas sp. YM274]WMI69005.1 lipocalin family protein [Mangrovimonas sp. YM274]
MKKLLVLPLALSLFNCNSEKYELLNGKWNCLSWTIESSEDNQCSNNVYFMFSPNKTYSSKIGNLEEKGHFILSGDKLICTPEGKMDIGVEINTLTTDTLRFTMNRSGQKEVITLLKE